MVREFPPRRELQEKEKVQTVGLLEKDILVWVFQLLVVEMEEVILRVGVELPLGSPESLQVRRLRAQWVV